MEICGDILRKIPNLGIFGDISGHQNEIYAFWAMIGFSNLTFVSLLKALEKSRNWINSLTYDGLTVDQILELCILSDTICIVFVL